MSRKSRSPSFQTGERVRVSTLNSHWSMRRYHGLLGRIAEPGSDVLFWVVELDNGKRMHFSGIELEKVTP